MAALDYQ